MNDNKDTCHYTYSSKEQEERADPKNWIKARQSPV